MPNIRLHNIKVPGETESTDSKTSASHPQNLAKIVDKDGYPKQIFQCRQDSLTLEEYVISDFHSYREVNAWLQTFKIQSNSLFRG